MKLTMPEGLGLVAALSLGAFLMAGVIAAPPPKETNDSAQPGSDWPSSR